jgi:predicted nuclease of predicted toxin-antitoxin system
MKFLLDMPVSASLLEVLTRCGYSGVHAGQIGLAQASDTALLALARDEDRVVITADLDFPRLLALSAAAGPGLILFRGGNYSDAEMRNLLSRVLDHVEYGTLCCSICVVDHKRIRITRLPLTRQS